MDGWIEKRVILVNVNYYIKIMAAEENVLRMLHL